MDFYLTTSASTFPCSQITWMHAYLSSSMGPIFWIHDKYLPTNIILKNIQTSTTKLEIVLPFFFVRLEIKVFKGQPFLN